MDSIDRTNVAPRIRSKDASLAPATPLRPQSYSLPSTLFLVALITLAAGEPVVKDLGGTIYPIAYMAGALAAICLPLMLIAGWRRGASETSRLFLGLGIEQWSFIAVFSLFLSFYGVTRFGATPFYEPSVQAAAFLHGHSWVDAPPRTPGYMEQVGPICSINLPPGQRFPECHFTRYGGRTFLVHPPLSAIILIPLVAAHGGTVAGADEYQPSVCAALGAIEVALAFRLLMVLGMSTSACLWLTALFGIGTTLWYEATLGASWDFVLVVSLLPTLLALNELFGKGRAWLVGVFAALAALGRYDLVMAWPFYGLLLLTRGRRIRDLFWMTPAFAMAGMLYGIFNYSRYGTFFDRSLLLWYRCCDGGGFFDPTLHQSIPGPFSLHFLPRNLHTVLFSSWSFNQIFPWLHPQGGGEALMLTSPAFVLTLRATFKNPATVWLWLAALLTMAGGLTVYANGFVQFGPRYWVQVYPFLLVLVALGIGAGRAADQLTKILVLASILLVAFGSWHIHMFAFG